MPHRQLWKGSAIQWSAYCIAILVRKQTFVKQNRKGGRSYPHNSLWDSSDHSGGRETDLE